MKQDSRIMWDKIRCLVDRQDGATFNEFEDYCVVSNLNLQGQAIWNGNFCNIEFLRCEMEDFSFRNCRIEGCSFIGCNLRDSMFVGSRISNTSFFDGTLAGAIFREASIDCVEIQGTNLINAELGDAKVGTLVGDYHAPFFHLQCPEDGSFIGYKKVYYIEGRNPFARPCIAKLEIPASAKRSSATTRKCRASEAKVLEILDMETKQPIDIVAFSNYDRNFVYRVGETVSVPDFCENRWQECAPGIHFFITLDEAVQY